MPIYQYACGSCRGDFERMISMSDMEVPLSEPCKLCGAVGQIQKVILTAPIFGDPVRLGFVRPPGDIREVLQKIQEKAPKATVKDAATFSRL